MTTFISTSKTRVFTAAGSPVLLGEPVDLTTDQQKAPENERLIDSGLLIESGVQLAEHDATDAAQEKALELGIDLGDVSGTGENGRIKTEDVVAAAAAREGSND